jgi:hypothetical protein
MLCGLLVAARPAEAGPASFESDQFHPSDTGNGYLAIDSAFTVRHLGYSAGLFGNYAHRVLVLRDPATGKVVSDVIGGQFAMDVSGSFGIFERVELGVDLPFVPAQIIDDSVAGVPGGIAAAGVGDLRLDVKVRVHTLRLMDENKLAFAVVAGLRLPTGDATSFLGQGSVSGYPRLVAEWRNRRAGVAINFGVVLRSTSTYNELLSITHQIAYGAAGYVNIAGGLQAIAELTGLVGVGLPAGNSLAANEAPTELDFGVRWRAKFGFEATVAGGVGLTRGYGTPDGRFLFGLRYQAPMRERAAPLPPPPPPEPDSDGDGVVDSRDHCPQKPGPRLNAGCPDEDSDGDGVVDRLDGCPMTPGPASNHGCPPTDRDHDGVADSVDRCPDQPGSAENDGCPDIDSDGDGLVDRLDKCPFDAETYNGNADEDGCPDPGPVLAELQPDKIAIKERIGIEGGVIDKHTLKTLSVVARFLVLHPEITKLRVEGHTDNRGSAIDNLDLSAKRAALVKRVLIEQFKIDSKRLVAQGFGPDRPIFDNRDPAARVKNNRIEFVILEKQSTEAP